MLILLKTLARHEFNSIQFIYIKFTVQLRTLICLVKAALNEIMWSTEKRYKIHWICTTFQTARILQKKLFTLLNIAFLSSFGII